MISGTGVEWSSGDYDRSGLETGSRANISEHGQGRE